MTTLHWLNCNIPHWLRPTTEWSLNNHCTVHPHPELHHKHQGKCTFWYGQNTVKSYEHHSLSYHYQTECSKVSTGCNENIKAPCYLPYRKHIFEVIILSYEFTTTDYTNTTKQNTTKHSTYSIGDTVTDILWFECHFYWQYNGKLRQNWFLPVQIKSGIAWT